jgi:hypothetical protein
MSEDELADLFNRSDEDGMAAVLAECQRRDRADSARRARKSVEAEWYDAAFAQFLAAEAECAGVLLNARGEAEGIEDPFSLWRGSAAWAEARASEELLNFWDGHGGRLSLAAYKRQLRMAKRAERDARDLAALADDGEPEAEVAPEPVPEVEAEIVPAWETVAGGAVRPVEVPIGTVTVAAWAAMDQAGLVTVHPSRERAERMLSPQSSDIGPMPVVDFARPYPEIQTALAARRAWLAETSRRRSERLANVAARVAARTR